MFKQSNISISIGRFSQISLSIKYTTQRACLTCRVVTANHAIILFLLTGRYQIILVDYDYILFNGLREIAIRNKWIGTGIKGNIWLSGLIVFIGLNGFKVCQRRIVLQGINKNFSIHLALMSNKNLLKID